MNIKFMPSISAFILAAMGFSGISTTARATDFNYNFVEGAYESTDLDGPDADIYRLSGSYALNPRLNVVGEYAKGDVDNPLGGNDFDLEEFAVGVEFNTGIAAATDLTANAKIVNQDVDVAGDDTGYGFGIGVRHRLMDKVEVDANIDYIDVHDEDDTRLKLGARYYLNEAISAGVDYSKSVEDTEVFSGNLRWNFE